MPRVLAASWIGQRARRSSSWRWRCSSVLPGNQLELDRGYGGHDNEEEDRQGGRVPELVVLEPGLVHVLDEDDRGRARTAPGQDEHLPEDLKRRDQLGDGDQDQHVAQAGNGDVSEPLPRTSPGQ